MSNTKHTSSRCRICDKPSAAVKRGESELCIRCDTRGARVLKKLSNLNKRSKTDEFSNGRAVDDTW